MHPGEQIQVRGLECGVGQPWAAIRPRKMGESRRDRTHILVAHASENNMYLACHFPKQVLLQYLTKVCNNRLFVVAYHVCPNSHHSWENQTKAPQRFADGVLQIHELPLIRSRRGNAPD